MTCPADRLDQVRAAFSTHIALSRAEPGCLSFDVTEPSPGIFAVSESFTDHTAFDAHQMRTAESDWALITKDLPRDYTLTTTALRPMDDPKNAN